LNSKIYYKKLSFFKKLSFLLVTIISLSGCAVDSVPSHIRDGKEYGKIQESFRSKWWNYYERALSFADGEFYQEAEADIKRAINQREKDQRLARTYGMHFTDYFPHRELGIIYYQKGDIASAEKELEISINQFPSAKAYFYLDRVRKSIIEQQGKQINPPNLVLDFKSDEIWTKDDPIIISGVAKDENYVSAVTIKDFPLFLEGSKKDIPFKKALSLSQGEHAVEVTAQNLPGKINKQRIIIHVDREGPVIAIEDIQSGSENLIISGSLYDGAGISELKINGKSVNIQKEKEVFFTHKLIADKDNINLTAFDLLGNQTAAQFTPHPQHDLTSASGIILASADSDIMLSLFGGDKDKNPPTIKLKGWTDSQTVYLEKIYIEGEISDENKIISLTINQKSVLRHEGKYLFFSHLADLNEGENQIRIEAEDEAGNKESQKITVIRKIPKALQLEERLSISVIPFDQSGEISDYSVSFQDNLTNSLVDRNRFRVIEREKLDVILQEQKLSQTNLIDKDTALKVGRLIAARSVITGNIIETRTGIEIVARVIDTETSEIMSSSDVYDEVKDLMTLKKLSEGMAIKFHQDFPLLDGMIIQQKGNAIFTDLGEEDKVKLQRRLIVYREEAITHPVTGKILGADNLIMGHARITQIMPDLSKAEMLDGESSEIRNLDKVITE